MAVDPNQTDTQKPSAVAPDLNIGSGGDVLQPGQRLQKRPVRGQAPSLETLPTSEQQYFSLVGGVKMYEGQYLVDADGMIARPQYNVNEAYSQLAALGDAANRSAFLNRLYALGVYGKSKPTVTGFAQRDQRAMAEAMLYANANGVTLDVALTKMAADPNVKANMKALGISGAGRVRTTPTQDLRAVFRQATGQVLGRQLSDAEIDKFIRSYNQAEVAEARGGAAAPSVQTAALQAAEAAAPDEAAAMGALQLTQLMENALKELG